jgi:hypothetical protein
MKIWFTILYSGSYFKETVETEFDRWFANGDKNNFQ